MREQSEWPRQAHFLRQLNQQKSGIWRMIPALLNAAGLLTAEKKPFSLNNINYWKAKRNSRRIPNEAISIVCKAYEGDEKGKALVDENSLRSFIKMDENGLRDFWESAEAALLSLEFVKLVAPPFTSHREEYVPGSSEEEEPFLEFWLSRFCAFSSHTISTRSSRSIGNILDEMIASRRTSTKRVGFGLLSSIERLTLLEPLHTPIRVGINAVVAVDRRNPLSRQTIANIRRLLCGIPAIENKEEKVIAIGAKHEVGFTHLMHMWDRGLWESLSNPIDIPRLNPWDFVDQMIQRTDATYFAVADEVTCLSIMKVFKERQTELTGEVQGKLAFSLASLTTVEKEKTRLPEYLMSILVPRDNNSVDDTGYRFLKDALWMLLQGDVELFAQHYADLCTVLRKFAEEALPNTRYKEARQWAEYTLRLDPAALSRYVDHELPWRPILERALELYQKDFKR